jgi:hypothetical protein
MTRHLSTLGDQHEFQKEKREKREEKKKKSSESHHHSVMDTHSASGKISL